MNLHDFRLWSAGFVYGLLFSLIFAVFFWFSWVRQAVIMSEGHRQPVVFVEQCVWFWFGGVPVEQLDKLRAQCASPSASL